MSTQAIKYIESLSLKEVEALGTIMGNFTRELVLKQKSNNNKEIKTPENASMSYAEFEARMKAITLGRKVAENIYLSNRNAIMQKRSAPKMTTEEIMIVELLMTMMCCINAVCCNHVQRLIDILKASATEKGREKYNVQQNYMNEGVVRSVVNKLQNVNNEHMASIEHLCNLTRNKGEEFVERIANAMDVAEECLDEPMKAYVRYFTMKSTRKSLSTPADPELMTSLMICVILTDINYNIFEHVAGPNNFPFIHSVEKYKIFSCNDLHNQIVKLTRHIEMKDTNGEELKFNASGVMNSKQSMEIFSDILTILYSSEFLDRISVARNNEDPLIRNECKSILPSYENKTESLEYYQNKYKDMYL